MVHGSVSMAVPLVGFVAALVAMALFYSVNALTTVDTFQSWTCRWRDVPMMTRPYFGTLCKESQASLALAILLVPLELLVLLLAGTQAVLERKLESIMPARMRVRGSPALS